MLFFGFGRLIYGMTTSSSAPVQINRSTNGTIANSHDTPHKCGSSSLRRPIPCKKYVSSFPYACSWFLTWMRKIVGWGRAQPEPGFGSSYDNSSIKARTVNLITSVRTVMRSMWFLAVYGLWDICWWFARLISTLDRDKYGDNCLRVDTGIMAGIMTVDVNK